VSDLEEGTQLQLDFKKLEKVARCDADVVPVAVQNADTREVILLAYANQEALRRSLETGVMTLYSTSRDELWIKGATSGNVMDVREVRIDCDGDTLLVLVDPAGPACHTGETACFFRSLDEFNLEKTERK